MGHSKDDAVRKILHKRKKHWPNQLKILLLFHLKSSIEFKEFKRGNRVFFDLCLAILLVTYGGEFLYLRIWRIYNTQ